jgi:putative MATE family efflux protein
MNKKQAIQLSDHFTYGKLLRFTLPSIAMMIFTSIYSVVDGFFISNYAGKTAFAAVNLVFPALMILGTVGFMIGTGGSALVGKTLGEGDKKKASELFSLFIVTAFVLGIVISVVGFIFLRQLAKLLGADDSMIDYCVTYGRIIIIANPFFILQMMFQSFFITAEKPKLGLISTVSAGCANMVLDFLLVGVFGMGVTGAALATAASQVAGGVIPLVYFLRPNTSLLKFTKFKFDFEAIIKACSNGISELLSQVSMSVVGILYNYQLMKYGGENAVAAYGVLMYVSMIFSACFIGYVVGTAPVVSFNYGAENHEELRNLRKKSINLIVGCGFAMVALSWILSTPLSKIFAGYDAELLEMTIAAFKIYSFAFLFMGMAIYGSSFFTALNNGLISAIISVCRTVVFQVGTILVLPLFLGVEGIWYSIVVAEFLAMIVSVSLIVAKRKKYGY